MSKIVNKSQVITTGVVYPRPVYSRVIGCFTLLPVAPVHNFAYTAEVGQRILILNVQIWIRIVPAGAAEAGQFNIRVGNGRPINIGNLLSWQNLVPLYHDGIIEPLFFYEKIKYYSFDMSVIFDGAPWRFGFDMINASTNAGQAWMTVQFSEL